MPSPPLRRALFTGVVFLIVGLTLLVGGIWLAVLGGSFYYLIAGLGIAVTGVLIFARHRAAVWLYSLVLLGTLIWSVAEVGFTFWQLEPRLVMPLVLGVWLLLPWVQRKLDAVPSARRGTNTILGLLVLVGVVTLGFAATRSVGIQGEAQFSAKTPDAHDTSVPDSDWQFYGRTPHGDRFSPLDQINTSNVKDLKLAWTARTGDTMRPGEDQGGTDAGHEFNFEDTPIKIDDSLYVCTGHSWVEAIDAATGKVKWKFDPKADTQADVYLACRGVSYYKAPAGTVTDCPERIIAPVLDARLMALNAKTGHLCQDFGDHGYVSMTQYLGHVPAGFHFVTSPPLVLKDRVILGGWVYDNQAEAEPSGAVRAFDPINGKLIWAWDVGHTPENWTPGPNDQLTRGTPNAWGVFTADPKLNMVYLPTGNATPDYYGGNRRPFDEKYNSSTVALDIETGAPRWHFQNVHHDLWDFDIPVGPSLVDLPGGPNGSTIPALVQTTKRGELFMLNRETGVPVAKVEEKAVPQGAVPGDHTSPTQAFSTGMPSLAPKDLTEASLWGATPIDQMMCRIEFRQAKYQGQFTPVSLKNTIVYPAFDGVIDWHGASIDPNHKILIANANYIPFMAKLAPRAPAVAAGYVKPWDGSGNEPTVGGGLAPQYGTPYVGKVNPWLNPLKVPCNSPPWGTLTAIDLTTRKIIWQHPLGTTRDTGPFGTHTNVPLPTGIFNIGGNMVTKGGLIFIGATADDYLRAIDERTGEVVWKARLPAGGQANPMSYSINGKQYIVIAAGGHAGLGTRSGDYVMAYALPDGSH